MTYLKMLVPVRCLVLSPERDGPLPRLSVLREPGERPRCVGVLDDDTRLGRVRVAWWEVVGTRAEWREGWVERAWLEAR